MTMSHDACVYLPHDDSHNPELEELTTKTQLTETFVGVSRFQHNETLDVRECPRSILDVSHQKYDGKVTKDYSDFFSPILFLTNCI